MLIARILLILVIFSVAICLGAYLLKGDKRYLGLIGQIVKYAFLLLLAGAVVMAIARIILV
ncbi:MAG: hypothetical protein RLZZ98_157 [Pseudomonadota bacterium]|jgi:hypothetical protein